MSKKINFSVVLIGRNESKTLPRLIGSLKEFQERGGEVVLVDTGSTDNTAQIGRDLGCKVTEVGDRFLHVLSKEVADEINKKFIIGKDQAIVSEGDKLFDYSAARNFAATLASNDVIATPDCDEIYTHLNLDKICEAIENGVDQLEYNFVFSHDEFGNELIKFMHSKFYNRKKLHWEGIIHEVLIGDAKREFFGEDIIKLEHWQNHETNRGHYLKGLALSCLKDPENDRNAHYLARELMYTGRFESAIKQFDLHIAMNRWNAEKSQSYLHRGECFMMMGNVKDAIHSWVDSFDACPTRREPLMKIAEYYYQHNNPEGVIAYAGAAVQIMGDNFYANFQPYYENLPHELLYWALWKKDEYHASKKHFDICLAYQPFNPKYLFDFRWYYELPKLSFIIPSLGRPEGLDRCVKSIQALNYPQEKIEVIIEEGDETVPKKLKSGVAKATGDWIVYAANDIEFHPDSIMCAFKQAMDNRKYFMAFNTQGEAGVSPDEGNICEHFMIHKKLIPGLGGEIFDTEFFHVGVDNLLWEKMKRINQAMRCTRAIVRHYHFSQTGEPMDDVAKIAWNEDRVKHDRDLLQVKLTALK